MPNNHGPVPYHPDPNEERNMDGIEVASPELSTQEFDNSVAAAQAGIEPEFVVVTRSKTTYWLQFPVSCFDDGASLTAMANWTIGTLKKVATVKPKSFAIETLPSATGAQEKFLIFQVYTLHEAEAACKHGSKDNTGNVTRFAIYTPEAQAAQQGRMLKIMSLSFDTTADQIEAALSKYGAIESVRTSFNAKATMITATVIYVSATTIETLKAQHTTYMQVRDDIATVTWLGNQPVHHNNLLTMKLAHLPIGINPVEIARLFAHPDPEDPNAAAIPFHSIVMP
ncbi:hypothetical protein BG015_006359, partial [Linnemannia schmuckeri]